MARRHRELPESGAVALVADPPDGNMDDWLASLVHNDPTELPLTAAELVAEARCESE